MTQRSSQHFSDLLELFEFSTRRYSQRPLFGVKQSGGWRWITYRDFGSQVLALRRAMARRGVKPGDRIALIASNSPAWATVAFAAYGLRAALVPIFPSSQHEDWEYILKDSQASWVFCATRGIAHRVQRVAGESGAERVVVCISGDGPEGALDYQGLLEGGSVDSAARHPPEPSDLSAIIYTSGTTGRPKGVELTHGSVASNLSALHQIFPVTEEDVSMCFLPWAHAFGQVVELYGLFSVGASMALAESDTRIMENLREVQPTLLFSVPKLFNLLHDKLRARVEKGGWVSRRVFEDGMQNARARRRLRADGSSKGVVELKSAFYDRAIFEGVRQLFGGRIRYAVSGGAPLAPEVGELVDSLGITLYEGYGLTETSPIVSANWPGARKLGSVGKPLPGVTVEIDFSVGDGEEQGEIVVRGPNVMRGYHGMPEETARVLMPDGSFRTGDLGYVDADGFLFVTGRAKEQYKLDNGRYVAPSPIEESLRMSTMIEAAMVHGEGRSHNIALIVPEVAAVKEWASERGLNLESTQALLHHPAVLSLFEREVAERTRAFRSYERCRGFLVLDRAFSVEDGTLTPTMKLRRGIVARRYADRMDALYGVSRGRAHAVDE